MSDCNQTRFSGIGAIDNSDLEVFKFQPNPLLECRILASNEVLRLTNCAISVFRSPVSSHPSEKVQICVESGKYSRVIN